MPLWVSEAKEAGINVQLLLGEQRSISVTKIWSVVSQNHLWCAVAHVRFSLPPRTEAQRERGHQPVEIDGCPEVATAQLVC